MKRTERRCEMSRRTLTIIDTTSEMREIDLDRIGKRELLLGAKCRTV